MTTQELPTGGAGAPAAGIRAGEVRDGAVLGLVTAAVALGVSHLVAAIVEPRASPILTVGQAAIDATPEWLKSWAIRVSGQNDKAVLLGGIAAVLLAVAVLLGIASVRRASVGLAGLGALGAVGVAAALTRPSAESIDALPALVGTVAGGATLLLLRRTLGDNEYPAAGAEREIPRGMDRRRFLLVGAAGVVAAVAAGGLGNLLARRTRADASRAAVSIPVPESPAPEVAGVQASAPGLGPFFTPNDRFYRVDTALLSPAMMAEDWRLKIHGMVDREIQLDYAELLRRPLVERDITLTCVSNPVGGRYAGNARWIGAPLAPLLLEAGVRPGADQIVSRSIDGFTVGTPAAVAMDGRDAMLAVAMNGDPLPIDHGFPVRMIVPGLYGYVSATKWIVEIELSTFDAFDPYWVQRGWAERAPIKTMSRIDTPTPRTALAPGRIAIAGVAWAQHVGIERVEVGIDDEQWRVAELAAQDTVDTWRQWVYRWDATPGEHVISVRATDRTGATQTADRAEPFPDGATGHHTISVRVD